MSGPESAPLGMAEPWRSLPRFPGFIRADDQVIVVAATGGAKSTLVASLTLDVDHLIAIDGKDSLSLPRSTTVALPPYPGAKDDAALARFDAAVSEAIAPPSSGGARRSLFFRTRSSEPRTDRIIVRVDAADIDDPAAHDRLFGAIYRDRRDTIVWIDEITATGSTAHVVPRSLRALSARGRTRGLGLWTLTQAPFGLLPGILRRNASIIILGPLEPQDVADVRREGVEITTTLPTRSGQFVAYRAGDRQPYRLYVPIPAELARWEAP